MYTPNRKNASESRHIFPNLHSKFNIFKSGPYIRRKSTAFLSFFHKQGVRAPKSRPKSSLKPRRSSPPPPPAQKSAQTKAKSTSKKPAHQVFTGAPTLTCTLFLLCACCLLLSLIYSVGFPEEPDFPCPSMSPQLYSAALLLVLFLLGLFLPDGHAKLCDHPVLDLLDEVVRLFVLEADGTFVR